MFYRARLKLTLWYVLILLSISGMFSFVVYQRISDDLARANRMFIRRELDQHLRLPIVIAQSDVDMKFFEDALDRLRLTLILINVGIALIAGGAGFFLAGQTLQPIQDMVDDQQRFIADASHELRTPLTAMRTQLEVTLRDTKRSTKETTEILKSNLEEVINLQNLSNNLLELVNNKKLQVIVERVDLQEVIANVVNRFQLLARQKHIAIESFPTNSSVLASREEVLSLLGILVDNAIKYSPENTVITLAVQEKGRIVTIQVKDQGVGIDPDDAPRVFDRFYRAEKSRKRSTTTGSGYGLGLSIAKKIVEKYNGKIAISSEPNKGTVVQLSFKKPTNKTA